MARIAFVLAFASTVDAFRPVSLGSFTPALRASHDAAMPSLGLRKHALKSSSLLGLRATASNSVTEALEKAYNDPSVPHSRERIYQIAQVRKHEDSRCDCDFKMKNILDSVAIDLFNWS
jgi:hypothetical protein